MISRPDDFLRLARAEFFIRARGRAAPTRAKISNEIFDLGWKRSAR
jgi:hypothetical protein